MFVLKIYLIMKKQLTIVYANYELRYVLNGLVYEPTMNDSGDDVLPTSKRKALNQVENMQYRTLS